MLIPFIGYQIGVKLLNANSEDIVLDESAFEKASNDYAELAGRLETLKTDIEEMLDNLQKGFDTPAGRKFVNSCKKNLLEPIEKQKLVLEHVSNNLKVAKTQYQKIFSEYQSLNNTLNSYRT